MHLNAYDFVRFFCVTTVSTFLGQRQRTASRNETALHTPAVYGRQTATIRTWKAQLPRQIDKRGEGKVAVELRNEKQ